MLTLNDGRSELWQWDTGRKLSVDADCSQVHFSNKVFGRSIDVDVVDGVATIPDILLQTDRDLIAWAFVGTPENGYTKISKVFRVNKRNKPADYVFTPPEQTTLGQIMERLDDLEAMQDPDAIKNAVDDYLANNPIQIDEKDPTVPAWAKQGTKPKYTATEVGAVATVNGVKPDANGNVEIEVSGGNVDLSITGASVGQTVRIAEVDENGVPTAWEPTDFPSGSSGGSGGGTKWETLVNEVWQRNRELKFTEYDADTLTYTFPDGTFTDDEIGTEIFTVICLDVNSMPDSWRGVFPNVLTPISTNQATIKAAQNSLLDGKNYWFEVPTLLHVKGINSKKIRVRWDGKVERSFESTYSKYFAYGMPDSQVASQIGYYQTKVARSIADIELELIAPYIVSGNLNAYIFAASDNHNYHKKWFSSYSPVLQDMSSVGNRQYAYSEDGLTFSGLCWSIAPWSTNTSTVAFIGNGTRIYVAREVDA